MTPFDSHQHEQERTEQQQQAIAEAHLDGSTDAAMGSSPSSKDEAYLAGYLEQLKHLILTSPDTLEIHWIPPQSNRFNYHDCDWSSDGGEF